MVPSSEQYGVSLEFQAGNSGVPDLARRSFFACVNMSGQTDAFFSFNIIPLGACIRRPGRRGRPRIR
jgi:hypothetical protein